MSAETAVQGALYAALTGLGLTAYDVAPQALDAGSDSGWPYVEVGFTTLAQWDSDTWNGFEFSSRIHTRSRSGSMAEAKTIQGQIYAELHQQPLTITGHQSVLMQRLTSWCDRAPDGTFHGVCEYRGLIKAT